MRTLCTVSTGTLVIAYADTYVPQPPYCTYQPPACCTYQRRRAACAEAPRTVRTGYAYRSRAVRTAYRGTTGCLWGVITSVSRSQVKERQPRVRPTLLEQTDIRSLRFDFAREELTLARRPLLGLDAVLSTYFLLLTITTHFLVPTTGHHLEVLPTS